MADGDLTKSSIEYVSSLSTDCAFDDGYVCVEPVQDEFVFAQDKMVPGPYLQAWTVVYAHFAQRDDLSAEQKSLQHYKIGLTEDEAAYLVVFKALLLPELEAGRPTGRVMRTSLGQAMRYLVDKHSLSILESKLYR